jgi:hypothetical protein
MYEISQVTHTHRVDEIDYADDDDPADVSTVLAQKICVRELMWRHFGDLAQFGKRTIVSTTV